MHLLRLIRILVCGHEDVAIYRIESVHIAIDANLSEFSSTYARLSGQVVDVGMYNVVNSDMSLFRSLPSFILQDKPAVVRDTEQDTTRFFLDW